MSQLTIISTVQRMLSLAARPQAPVLLACAWIDIGEQGLINQASELGKWQQGQKLLAAFAAGVCPAPRG